MDKAIGARLARPKKPLSKMEEFKDMEETTIVDLCTYHSWNRK